MKKRILIVLLLLVSIGVVLFSPSEITSNKCDTEDEECKNLSNNNNCFLPPTGCVNSCRGFELFESCNTGYSCVKSCSSLCFGMQKSLCQPGKWQRKVDFLNKSFGGDENE